MNSKKKYAIDLANGDEYTIDPYDVLDVLTTREIEAYIKKRKNITKDIHGMEK